MYDCPLIHSIVLVDVHVDLDLINPLLLMVWMPNSRSKSYGSVAIYNVAQIQLSVTLSMLGIKPNHVRVGLLKQDVGFFGMFDFICISLRGMRSKLELQNKKILPTVGFEPPTSRLRSRSNNCCGRLMVRTPLWVIPLFLFSTTSD